MTAFELELREGERIPASPRRRSRVSIGELAWDILAGLAFGIAAIVMLVAIASPIPEDPPRPNVLASANWGAGATPPDTITVRITADGGLRTLIQASEIQMVIPKDSTVTMLWNRLTDKYPILSPLAMLHTDNKMLPMNSIVQNGQVIALSR